MPRRTVLAQNPNVRRVARLVGHVVRSPQPCPICGDPMPGRKTSACSDKCRAAKSRRQRSKAQAERDERALELLQAAVRCLGEWSSVK